MGTFTLHADKTIDVTTRDGRIFRLIQTPAKSTPVKTSRRCIWCDNFGHCYSECQEFHDAILYDRIYVSKNNRIFNARTGNKLPLATGRGGMKAYL
jgi:hypothetical protein